MSDLVSVGLDPGVATGFFFLHEAPSRSRAVQCDAVFAPALLEMLLARYDVAGVPCGVEKFVRGARMLKGAYADVTRDLVTILRDIAAGAGMDVHVRPAAMVKPWAGDARLERAGLLGLTGHGMVHARDGARHALYAAVRAGKLPDPLSRNQPLMRVMKDEDDDG